MVEYVRLGDIAKISSGGTPSRSNSKYWENGTIPWVKISDIEGKYVSETEEKISELGLVNSSAKIFPKGTILYTIFATLGDVGILNIDAATNQAIAGIQFNDDAEVDKNYAYYFLISLKDDVNTIGRGVAQRNINQSILKNIKIPLPPLQEQQHIAKVLDAVSALIAKRKQQIALLDDAVKSLFVEMFGDPVGNPMGWEVVTIRDIVSDVKYGTSKKACESGEKGDYVYLRMNNITYDGRLDLSDIKYINLPKTEIEKYIIRKGDVLFNRTNSKELVGKTCVFNENTPMIIAGYIIRVRGNEKVIPEYISAYLNSKYMKKTLFEMCKSIIGQANINAQELQDIKIPLPPLTLQNQFAARIEKIETQRKLLDAGLKRMEKAYGALMQEYFG